MSSECGLLRGRIPPGARARGHHGLNPYSTQPCFGGWRSVVGRSRASAARRTDMVQRSVFGLLRGFRRPRRPPADQSNTPEAVARWGGDSKLRNLSAIDILRDLQPNDFDWLAAHTTMITARRGQLLYMPGETREALFLLKSGRVRIYRL